MEVVALLRLLVLVPLLGAAPPFRLPRTVFPSLYTLEIVTDMASNGNFTFEGRVWIQVHCNVSTDTIVMHVKHLHVFEHDVKVSKATGGDVKVTSHKYDTSTDFYMLQMSEPLREGSQYVVYIPYHGVLTEGLAGYYLSSYRDSSSRTTRWLAVTQFESTDARRAFPCFDEPGFKAKFKVSLGRQERLKSCSNMPMEKSEPMKGMSGWIWDRYAVSERMSTYLVAFMVSDLEFRVSDPVLGANNITFRIWARHDALKQTEYAGTVGPQVLHFYEQFFDVKYPLPKQDMAAIPDFSAGAMENWGLITYRETALLYDPDVSSLNNKKYVASVISHELAHQWFGNLVTMKWWTDLWLNEGFATFVAILGVDTVHPEWNSLNIEMTEALQSVFIFDSLTSSHPVSVKIEKPEDIAQIFDSISYKKGCSLLRMMSLFLGLEVFRNGVSQYLKTHRFDNAEQDDLWNSLTSEAHRVKVLPKNMTMKMIMDTWTLQTGFPVLNITRDYNSGTASITQKRFLSYKEKAKGRPNKEAPCWIAPLSYTTQSEADFNNTLPRAWTSCQKKSTTVTGLPGGDQWVIFNVNMTGLYRVHYDEKNWELISTTLKSGQFETIGLLNRVQILDDVMNFAWTGQIKYHLALRITDYLYNETEYLPWRAAFRNFYVLDRLMRRNVEYGDLRTYLRKLLKSEVKKIDDIAKYPDTVNLEKLMQHNLVVSWACRLDMSNFLQQATDLYRKWMSLKNPDVENPIPSELRSTVCCYAIKYGGEKEWDFAWDRYRMSNVGSEKANLLSQLGCTRDPWLLNRYLNWTLQDGRGIRKQDAWTVFGSVAENEVGFDIAKQFFMTRISDLFDFYSPKTSHLKRYLGYLAAHMYRETDLKELEDFLSANKQYLKGVDMAAKQAVESVRIHVQWYEQCYQEFVTALRTYKQ